MKIVVMFRPLRKSLVNPQRPRSHMWKTTDLNFCEGPALPGSEM